uniref:Uncharacterized protein n=1 Tax=Salmo trutta TaxID=8032 RepID=A0A674AHU7_SALTR
MGETPQIQVCQAYSQVREKNVSSLSSFRLFDEQKDLLILVFFEEIPDHQLSSYHHMRKLVKRRTYMSWPRAGEHTGVFWQKLWVALETRDCPAMENPILTRVERT